MGFKLNSPDEVCCEIFHQGAGIKKVLLHHRQIAVILGSLMILATTLNCLEINCNFQIVEWENMGLVYTCSVMNLTVTTPNENVTAIIGVHTTGESNNDVKKLNINRQTCEFLPQGFEKFFPNLEGIRVAQSGLVSLKVRAFKSSLKHHLMKKLISSFNIAI